MLIPICPKINFWISLPKRSIDNIKREAYIASIAMLLMTLWDIGSKAVAAYDFENELPKTGRSG